MTLPYGKIKLETLPYYKVGMWAVLCGTAIQSPPVIVREQALKTIPLEKVD